MCKYKEIKIKSAYCRCRVQGGGAAPDHMVPPVHLHPGVGPEHGGLGDQAEGALLYAVPHPGVLQGAPRPCPVQEGAVGCREGEEGALLLPRSLPGVAAAGAGEEELAGVGVHRDGGHPALDRRLKQKELLNLPLPPHLENLRRRQGVDD